MDTINDTICKYKATRDSSLSTLLIVVLAIPQSKDGTSEGGRQQVLILDVIACQCCHFLPRHRNDYLAAVVSLVVSSLLFGLAPLLALLQLGRVDHK